MTDLASITIKAWLDQFSIQQGLAEGAIGQLNDDQFFVAPAPDLNSCAVIVRHVAGSSTSRMTDFLTTDGEKPWRDREDEFDASGETRVSIMEAWDAAWELIASTVGGLSAEDLLKTITIRTEPHSVPMAIDRLLGHVAIHTGQLLWAARMIKGEEFVWQTIAPGQSASFNESMRNQRHGA